MCGHTLNDFRKTGKFGCGECYNTFRAPVTETLRRIHSNPVHTGKIPSRSAGSLKRERMYAELKKQLSAAVQNEDYEQAAKLHKQIKEMESEM
jgi:protein arginine kinase activator